MRREYEMTNEQLERITKASKRPLHRRQRRGANDAWAALGRELAFEHMTVLPVRGKASRFFTAEEEEPMWQYLGDGVYASSDGCNVVLDLRKQDSTTRIVLEPDVFDALIRFNVAAIAKYGVTS